MQMSRTQKILSLMFCLVAVSACTRQAEKTALRDATVVLGPVKKDTLVSLETRPLVSIRKNLFLDEGNMPTAEYFRLVDDLRALSVSQNDADVHELARRLYDAFYRKGDTYTKSKFGKFYLEAMVGQAEPEVHKQLTVIARDVSVTKQKLTQLLTSSGSEYPWPDEIGHLNEALSTADNYVNWLLKAIPRLNLTPELSKPVVAAVRSEYLKYRPGLVEMARGLEGSRDFGQAVKSVKLAVGKFKVKLPTQHALLLSKAEDLSQSLATAESSQDALVLIIQVWRLVPEANREEVFKPVVPELYDFLNGKSELSLDCLSASICINPVLELARRVAILPKLTEFGVDKIRHEIDKAARDYLIKTMRAEAKKLLPQIPVEALNNLTKETERYQALIGKIQTDFPGFARTRANKWAETEFKQTLRGLEVGRVRANMLTRDDLSVEAVAEAKDKVSTGAEALGLSLSLAHQFLPAGGDRLRPALLEPVLKLLAISGFRQANGKQFASFLMPLDSSPSEIFKIEDITKGTTSFAVPDAFTSTGDFVMDRARANANSSVRAQAELLRGIARQIRYHRDWVKNDFDEQLGSVQVEDLASEIPKGAVDYSLFPKDMIFALALGDAGAILQNVIRELSPAFVFTPGKDVMWGNRYKDFSTDNLSTIAGLVSIENGVRSSSVRTADIARFVLALSEFMEATEGMENTKAPPLKVMGDDGVPLMTTVLDARNYIKLFQMGLTNFLIHAQSADGSVHGQFRLQNNRLVKVDGPIRLEDQVLAIRAMTASAKSLYLPVFRWAALDAYYFLNKSMWDRKQQFYAPELPAPGKPVVSRQLNMKELALALSAIDELAPHMPTESRQQWEKIARPWVRALADL